MAICLPVTLSSSLGLGGATPQYPELLFPPWGFSEEVISLKTSVLPEQLLTVTMAWSWEGFCGHQTWCRVCPRCLPSQRKLRDETKEGPIYLFSALTSQPRPVSAMHQGHKPVGRSRAGHSGSFRHTSLITLPGRLWTGE